MSTAALLCSGLLNASPAQATTATVGQLFAPNFTCVSVSRTRLQTSVESGNSYTVPFDGVITSWSVQDDATPPTGLKLKVGRPAGGGSFTIIGEATAGPQVGNAVNTYPAQIPVTAGDVIGTRTTGGDCAMNTASSSDIYYYLDGDLSPGTTAMFNPSSNNKLPVVAQVQPPPGVSSISPAAGPIRGGTHVTIAGHDFTGATAVSFGAVPAQSFTVASDGRLTTRSPRAVGGTVDVRVSTPAGQTPILAGDRFTFGCVVPNLKGKKLKKARKALRNDSCRLGKVKGPKTSKVKRQKPRAGAVLPAGSKVNVKLG